MPHNACELVVKGLLSNFKLLYLHFSVFELKTIQKNSWNSKLIYYLSGFVLISFTTINFSYFVLISD